MICKFVDLRREAMIDEASILSSQTNIESQGAPFEQS
jgi:hypothetical protein